LRYPGPGTGPVVPERAHPAGVIAQTQERHAGHAAPPVHLGSEIVGKIHQSVIGKHVYRRAVPFSEDRAQRMLSELR